MVVESFSNVFVKTHQAPGSVASRDPSETCSVSCADDWRRPGRSGFRARGFRPCPDVDASSSSCSGSPRSTKRGRDDRVGRACPGLDAVPGAVHQPVRAAAAAVRMAEDRALASGAGRQGRPQPERRRCKRGATTMGGSLWVLKGRYRTRQPVSGKTSAISKGCVGVPAGGSAALKPDVCSRRQTSIRGTYM